jgi:hypothetical protein
LWHILCFLSWVQTFISCWIITISKPQLLNQEKKYTMTKQGLISKFVTYQKKFFFILQKKIWDHVLYIVLLLQLNIPNIPRRGWMAPSQKYLSRNLSNCLQNFSPTRTFISHGPISLHEMLTYFCLTQESFILVINDKPRGIVI